MRALPSFAPFPAGRRVEGAPAFRYVSHDGCVWFLCFCLAGHALAGKGATYVGVPPVLVSEVLLLGLVVFAHTRCWFALAVSQPALILALEAWALPLRVGVILLAVAVGLLLYQWIEIPLDWALRGLAPGCGSAEVLEGGLPRWYSARPAPAGGPVLDRCGTPPAEPLPGAPFGERIGP